MSIFPTPERLPMRDADVTFYPQFFAADEAEKLFTELAEQTAWKQEAARFGGKSVPLPRLTAWYGDEGKSYRYSGITVNPTPWTPLLLEIKARVETVSPTAYNSVLLNYYRSERDSVSWHSDDEPELGKNPVIASASFGATRKFQFKHKQDSDLRYSIELTSGSLLVMAGATQHTWKHQIPKTTIPHGGRINLTFRVIW